MLATCTAHQPAPTPRLRSLQRTLLTLIGLIACSVAVPSVSAHKIDIFVGAVVERGGTHTNLIKQTMDRSEEELADICKSLPNYHLTRGAVELMILTRALKLSGLDFNLIIKRMPIQKRTLSQLVSGNIHLSSETLWVDELARQQYPVNTTAPIIRFGEIEKGLYTSKSKAEEYSKLSINELTKLRIAIVRQWQLDIDTLKAAGFKNLVYVNTHMLMLDFVDLNRADATLLGFNAAEGMVQKHKNPITLKPIKLLPVPNVKIGIADSRAYVVSRTAPNSKIIEKALNKGLDIMLASGEINRALVANGIIDTRVENWTQLNMQAHNSPIAR